MLTPSPPNAPSDVPTHGPLDVAEEVADALADGRPVVALESTIIAHGFPRPRNLRLAHDLEQLLRSVGVTPATVAVLDGRVRVGLDEGRLARVAEDDTVTKASVRDLPVVLAQGRAAATTVASTALVAHLAGIPVFATGGLGGVHREADRTFDESADLTTLSRTPILVVAAGVKSILDVPATLERLETLGITVVGYRTERFPGFYVSDSGEPIDGRVDDPDAAAAVQLAARALGLEGAVLVANPIESSRQLDPELHDRVLTESLAAADAQGIRGKDVTPFLLDHIQRATRGASLDANVAAVTGNVVLAGAIARSLALAGSSA